MKCCNLTLIVLAGLCCLHGRGASSPDEVSAAPSSKAVLPAVNEKSTRFLPVSGRIRITGTTSFHDWTAESTAIAGFLEVFPGFLVEPGQNISQSNIAANLQAKIPVNSLRGAGNTASRSMSEAMHVALRYREHSNIICHLNQWMPKQAAPSKDAAHEFQAQGELVIGGVKKPVTIPVKILPMESGRLKLKGETAVKMSDYKIEPRRPVLSDPGPMKIDDNVKLTFDCIVAETGN